MTAEVGVINRLGVALAADSAVTLGGASGKIYTSAEKLFHLTQSAPIGIMVFGNAHFVEIPWETIIKVFRADLGPRRFDTTEEYATAFFAFLQSRQDLFPTSAQDRQARALIYYLFHAIRHHMNTALQNEAESRGEITAEQIPGIASAAVKEFRERFIKGHEPLQAMRGIPNAAFSKKYRAGIKAAKSNIFGNMPIGSATSRLLTQCATASLRLDSFGVLRSGVVVAGFGEKEFAPSLYSYDVEEMAMGRVRHKKSHECRTHARNPSAVYPFAQDDVVYAFMEGIDRGLLDVIHSSTQRVFNGAVQAILDALESAGVAVIPGAKAAIEPAVQSMLSKLFDGWESYRSKHWRPVLQIVASLPKDELGMMAESLVNLTKFRRRVTTEKETVGGPIDVAVITKGDGFVWIKRKHYFEPGLNPRTMGRLRAEGACDEGATRP